MQVPLSNQLPTVPPNPPTLPYRKNRKERVLWSSECETEREIERGRGGTEQAEPLASYPSRFLGHTRHPFQIAHSANQNKQTESVPQAPALTIDKPIDKLRET